jgi:hypothetical protein
VDVRVVRMPAPKQPPEGEGNSQILPGDLCAFFISH